MATRLYLEYHLYWSPLTSACNIRHSDLNRPGPGENLPDTTVPPIFLAVAVMDPNHAKEKAKLCIEAAIESINQSMEHGLIMTDHLGLVHGQVQPGYNTSVC